LILKCGQSGIREQTTEAQFVGTHAADGPNGMAYILDNLNGNVYTISEDNHTDNGTAILCQLITPKYDFDTFNRKFMSRFTVIGDWPSTVASEALCL